MEEDKEIIKIIFEFIIKQYEKTNTINVGILPNGQNVIYKKIKIPDNHIEFMKKYIEDVED